jgi:hypothetical protein
VSLGPDIPVNTGLFKYIPVVLVTPQLQSVSRSPRTDNISTSSNSTSPPVLPAVELHAASDAAVRFSPVQRWILLNPELDRRSGSGKSLNPNLNPPERFFQSGSGSGPL